MKLIKIAFSNIRKRKSSAVTLFIITILSAFVLSISLSIVLNINRFYDDKRIELNAPDISIAVKNSQWHDSMIDYAKNFQDVKSTELTSIYLGSVKHNNSNTSTQSVFYNESERRNFNTFTVIDKLLNKPSDCIILPLTDKYSGINAGDRYSIQSNTVEYNFTVYGFYEHAELGSTMSNVKAYYLSADIYEELSYDTDLTPYRYLSLRFNSMSSAYEFQASFLTKYSLGSSEAISIDYNSVKMGATIFPLIIALVLILVAAIIMIITLIITRFTIINNIEEDIKTLGALKSIGFTSRQIIQAILIQFFAITFAGCIIGVILSFLATGYVGNIISSTSGLLWHGTSLFVPAVLSALLIIGITSFITYLVSRRSKTVTPITALRTGLSSHSFKKNVMPLDKPNFSLNLTIAAKNFAGNIKNNIVAFVVVFLFASLTVLAGTLNYNFVSNTTALQKMIGIESADVTVMANSEQFALDNFADINAGDNVTKTLKYDVASTMCENKLVNFYVWEDIKKREVSTLVEGRYPTNDNEITLAANTQKLLGKKVGDFISLEYEGKLANYLITGMTQGVGDTATYGDMTFGGFARLKDNAVLKNMFVYLNNSDNEFIENFLNSLQTDYGQNIYAINHSTSASSLFSSMKSPMEIASYLIAAIAVFVICFVFFLMINTIIRRSKKDFGIMKALGFTNRQLIIQMLLSFLPVILTGVLLGTIFAVFTLNPAFGLILNGIGIAKAEFIIPTWIVVISEIALIGVCVLTVFLISLKTKTISPKKLIVE